MTTDKLLDIVSQRGLRVELKDGQPCLIGPADQRTPSLMAMLKEHKTEILRRLGVKNLIPWVQWTDKAGIIHAETEEDYYLFDRRRRNEGQETLQIPEGEYPPCWYLPQYVRFYESPADQDRNQKPANEVDKEAASSKGA